LANFVHSLNSRLDDIAILGLRIKDIVYSWQK
jgi:hypothetical protein